MNAKVQHKMRRPRMLEEMRLLLHLLVQLMDHFNKQTFVFVQFFLSFFNQSVRHLRVQQFTPPDHGLKVSVVGEIGVIDHVGHESVTSVKACYFVVLLQDLAKAAVGHDAKVLEEQEIRMEPVNAFGYHAPELRSVLPTHNVAPFDNSFFSNGELVNHPVEKMNSLLKFRVQKFEEQNLSRLTPYGLYKWATITLFCL